MSSGDAPKTPDPSSKHSIRRPRPDTHQPSQPRPRSRRKRIRSRKVRAAITFARVAICGYAAILLVLVLMEDRLVYPGAFMEDTSIAENRPPIQTVSYDCPGSIRLSGRLLEVANPESVILFFHGNASKAKWLDGWLIQLSRTFAATVMAAEYRGYEDDIRPTERGILEDCFAARDYLCDRYDLQPTDIVIYGRSLGGGCAVAVAGRGGAKALILESTFDRMTNVASDRYSFVPINLLMRNRYDSIAKMTTYRGPLIQIHSTADTVIPYERGRALFDSARTSPKHFIEVETVDHIEAMPPSVIEEAAAKLREFTSESSTPDELPPPTSRDLGANRRHLGFVYLPVS